MTVGNVELFLLIIWCLIIAALSIDYPQYAGPIISTGVAGAFSFSVGIRAGMAMAKNDLNDIESKRDHWMQKCSLAEAELSKVRNLLHHEKKKHVISLINISEMKREARGLVERFEEMSSEIDKSDSKVEATIMEKKDE